LARSRRVRAWRDLVTVEHANNGYKTDEVQAKSFAQRRPIVTGKRHGILPIAFQALPSRWRGARWPTDRFVDVHPGEAARSVPAIRRQSNEFRAIYVPNRRPLTIRHLFGTA